MYTFEQTAVFTKRNRLTGMVIYTDYMSLEI
jgi:hypothetical protein